MSDHVLMNLFNEFRKVDKIRGLLSCNELNIYSIIQEQNFFYYMTLRIL